MEELKIGQETYDIRDPQKTPLTIVGLENDDVTGTIACSYYSHVEMDVVVKRFKVEHLYLGDRKLEVGW
ncbi:hypothetical protein [Sphingobacterium suaedae]|uniref:Phage protein n=1 Tax=Sphingobacterium suaedae TaxID=1686402 RepID=A0ABW5KDZ7_9SPHI